MDAVDIILRVCLWASVALIPILLLWALFGARLSGSLKRSRPKAKPVRRQGLTPSQPSTGSRRPEISRRATGGTGTSPRPDASKLPAAPKPRPASGRGFILPPPRYDKPAGEAPASAAAAEAPFPTEGSGAAGRSQAGTDERARTHSPTSESRQAAPEATGRRHGRRSAISNA